MRIYHGGEKKESDIFTTHSFVYEMVFVYVIVNIQIVIVGYELEKPTFVYVIYYKIIAQQGHPKKPSTVVLG